MKPNQIVRALTVPRMAVKVVVIAFLLLGVIGCKKDKTVPEPPAQADVVVSALSVNKGPGLTPVVISGSGFSTTIKDNKVTFNGVIATVTAATATSLTVTVPIKAGTGSVKVQVADKVGIGPNFEYVFTYLVSTIAGSPGSYGYKDGTAAAAKFSDQCVGLRMGKDGNLYLVDVGNNRIRKITPDGVVSTYAGSVDGFRDGSLLTAQFSGPTDIALGSEDGFYISDVNNTRIRKISNGVVTTFAGGTSGYMDGQGTAAKFNLISRITNDSQGNVYVADDGNYNIRKITPSGLVTTLAGGNGNIGYADGQGSAARFSFQFGGIVTDSKNNIYVSDPGNTCIRKITTDGLVSTFAGVKGQAGSIDGPLSTARLRSAGYLATDLHDNLYFYDLYQIRRVSVDGVMTTIAGTGKDGNNDGPALQAQFKAIGGLALSSDGNTIYMVDYGLGTIRKIEAQ